MSLSKSEVTRKKKPSVTKFCNLCVIQFISCEIIKEIWFCSYEEMKEMTKIQDVEYFQILEWELKDF